MKTDISTVGTSRSQLKSLYNSLLINYNGPIMTKVQLTLTDQEAAVLKGLGYRFGYSLTKTLKYLVSKEVDLALQNGVLPTFMMSKRMEKIALQAEKEYAEGKTSRITNIDEFFAKL